MPLNPSNSVSDVNGINVILPEKCAKDDVKSVVKTMDDNGQMELSNIDHEQ